MTRDLTRRPTLADVAAEAGVSTVTVSRVVEGSSKVAARTRDKVLAAMETLGYYGNAAASQLVSGRTRTIAVVASNTSDFGYAGTISGLEQRAREQDKALLIAVTEAGDEAVRKTVSTVASQAIAGAVVLDFDAVAHPVLEALPAYLPVVGTARPRGEAPAARPYVEFDEYRGTMLAAQHVIELGHRSVFMLGRPGDETWDRRSQGVQDALDAALLPHYPVFRCESWKPEAGYARASEVLDRYGDVVTALVCANDEIALGAVRAVHDRGLRVPEDVSVIGFDDNALSAFTTPSITTVRQDFPGLGRAALDLLLAVAAGEEVETVPAPAPPVLVVRESTAPPAPGRG